MVYHVDGKEISTLEPVSFDALNVAEADIEEWVIETPSILGKDLLVVASQYAKFDRPAKRPDVVALNPDGEIVGHRIEARPGRHDYRLTID